MQLPIGVLTFILFCCTTALAEEPVLPTAFFTNLKAGKSQTVVTYGTSLTAGKAWVPFLSEWLEKRYPGKVNVINSACPGQHSGWGLSGVQKLVVDSKPDLVFIEFGINDAVLRFHLPVEKARANLDGIIDAIQKNNPHVEIVLMTMNAVVDVRERNASKDRPHLADYYANYVSCAAARHLCLVDNHPAWKRLIDEDLKTFLGYAPDGLHPMPNGFHAIAWPNIEKLLTDADSAAK